MRLACLIIGLAIICPHDSLTGEPSTSGIAPAALYFREAELLSRTWKDAAGSEIKYLERQDVPHDKLTTLTIIKYGSIKDNSVYCVDFYRKGKMVSGQEQLYVLLYHDYDERRVSKVTVSEKEGRIGIDIYRKGNSAESGSSYHFVYSTNGFHKGISEFIHVPK